MASDTSFAPAHLAAAMDEGVGQAEKARAALQTAGTSEYRGRFVEHDGDELINFVSCSYLGLEQKQELKDAAIDAIHRYGTQFSCSRAVIQSPLYVELEERLREMTGGYAVAAATTTLAHIAALPVLTEPGDVVLIDHFAHASLHTAVALLHGIPVETVRHSRMDVLESRIKKLSVKHRRVWYVLDGLYSILGEFAPMADLAALLEKYPSLHLYVDDAHSTSWIGTHGRGYGLEHLRDRSRVVGVLSLNKAFSAGGAALILPTQAAVGRVRRAGGPMVFGGPLQPPLLGAAVASARLHLTAELVRLQQELAQRLELTVSLAHEYDIPLADETLSPIFYVRCGSAPKTFAMVNALRARKMIVMPAFYPIVPHNMAGIRFAISTHNAPEDIRAFMQALSLELPKLEGDYASGTRSAAAPADTEEAHSADAKLA